MVQQIQERALDRRLSRLAEPTIPPELVARMIAEIPRLPQDRPDEDALAVGSRGIQPAPIATSRPSRRHTGIAGVLAGLAACFGAMLFLPQQSSGPKPAPVASVPVHKLAARTVATLPALALEAPRDEVVEPVAQAPARAIREAAKPKRTSPTEDAPAVTPPDAEAQLAAAPAKPESAPVELAAPVERMAVGPVAGPPAPDDTEEGQAIPSGSPTSRSPVGMGFDGMGARGFPGGGPR